MHNEQTNEPRPPSFRMYKPRKDGSGFASEFEISGDYRSVFLTMARQNGVGEGGHARFDWKKKVAIKLSPVEMSDIIRAIRFRDAGVGPTDMQTGRYRGIFHQTPTTTTSLAFGVGDRGFMLRVVVQQKNSGNKTTMSHGVTDAEAVALEIYLTRAVECLFGF